MEVCVPVRVDTFTSCIICAGVMLRVEFTVGVPVALMVLGTSVLLYTVQTTTPVLKENTEEVTVDPQALVEITRQ